jgi:hypothetical protein
MALSDLPIEIWKEITDQIIYLAHLDAVQEALRESFEISLGLRLVYVTAATVKVRATADCPARVMMCGVPDILNPGRITAGLSDGRYRQITADATVNFAISSTFWGNEKSSQWYLVYAVAGDEDTAFALKAMPWTRVKADASQVISLGTLLDPSAGIGYGFTTDELVGGKIYIISGARQGLLRSIAANNNDNGTGGTITYDGAPLILNQGDWFIILPPAINFKWLGDFYNNSSGDIVEFKMQGRMIEWISGFTITTDTSGDQELIKLCSPLASKVTLMVPAESSSMLFGPSGKTGAGAINILTNNWGRFQVENCKFYCNGSYENIKPIAFEYPAGY